MRDPRQLRVVDPFDGSSPVPVESCWRGGGRVLRLVVLHELPAARLGDDPSDAMGRPSAESFAMCGLLLVREFRNRPVPETHEAVLFRADLHWAFNLEPGFAISQRTIERH